MRPGHGGARGRSHRSFSQLSGRWRFEQPGENVPSQGCKSQERDEGVVWGVWGGGQTWQYVRMPWRFSVLVPGRSHCAHSSKATDGS